MRRIAARHVAILAALAGVATLGACADPDGYYDNGGYAYGGYGGGYGYAPAPQTYYAPPAYYAPPTYYGGGYGYRGGYRGDYAQRQVDRRGWDANRGHAGATSRDPGNPIFGGGHAARPAPAPAPAGRGGGGIFGGGGPRDSGRLPPRQEQGAD
jgi:hypothetical protein